MPVQGSGTGGPTTGADATAAGNRHQPTVNCLRYGQSAWLVSFTASSRLRRNELAQQLAARLRRRPEIDEAVAGIFSVTVCFDPSRHDAEGVRSLIERLARIPSERRPGRTWCVPVRFGGSCGVDLEAAAAALQLTPRQLVERFCGVTYHVLCQGFTPGFAYLGWMPAQLSLPRRSEPRPRVPSGSVAIAAGLCAIYPFDSPGGWHIVGHTDFQPIRLSASHLGLLRSGDRLVFTPHPDSPSS